MAKISAIFFLVCSLAAVLSFVGGSVAYGLFCVIAGLVGCFVEWVIENAEKREFVRKRSANRVGVFIEEW